MLLDKRKITSPINGALSRGPVTVEGKLRSSLNAERHGLLSKYSVVKLESSENFAVVIQDHVECFEPQGGVQEGVIEDMVSAYWRMHRLRAMETDMMNQAIDGTSPNDPPLRRMTDAFSALIDTPRYNLLNIYEGRLHRRYHRALQSLVTVDDYRERKAEKRRQQEQEQEQEKQN